MSKITLIDIGKIVIDDCEEEVSKSKRKGKKKKVAYGPKTQLEWFKRWYYNDETFSSIAASEGTYKSTVAYGCYRAGFYSFQEQADLLGSYNRRLLKELEECKEDWADEEAEGC